MSQFDTREIEAGLRRVAVDATNAAARAAHTYAMTRMGQEGGRVVRKTRKGRNVYEAAPRGRFPFVRTGNLRRSLDVRRADPQKDPIIAEFGSEERYAPILNDPEKLNRPWATLTTERPEARERMMSAALAAARRLFSMARSEQ